MRRKDRVKIKKDKKLEPLYLRWKEGAHSKWLSDLKTQKQISKRTSKINGKYDFRFVNLRKTRLADALILNACLDSICAYQLYLKDCNMKNSICYNGDFNDSNFMNTTFIDNEFYNCDFQDAKFSNVVFENSILKDCNFQKCNFENINFENSVLDNSDFLGMINPGNVTIEGKPKSVKGLRIDRYTFLVLKNSDFKNLVKEEGEIFTMGNNKEYDVALSFAGEQREYVESVAEYLRKNHINVFYDNYEKASLWGKDLVTHLTELYSKKCQFVIIFTSEEYRTKAWTNIERRSALTKFLRGQYDKVLTIKMDDAEIPGITDGKGYLDSREISPEKVGELFIEKFKVEMHK